MHKLVTVWKAQLDIATIDCESMREMLALGSAISMHQHTRKVFKRSEVLGKISYNERIVTPNYFG